MNHGAKLERYLDQLHNGYRMAGHALIFKVPTPVQIQGSKGQQVTGRKLKAVYVDYAGTLIGGMSVAIEAKCIAGDRKSFPLGNVKPHQRQTLTMVDALGGIAALYVRRLNYGGGRLAAEDYFVPVSFVDACPLKSFRWTDVAKFRVPPGKTWLDALSWRQSNSLAWAVYCAEGWEV